MKIDNSAVGRLQPDRLTSAAAGRNAGLSQVPGTDTTSDLIQLATRNQLVELALNGPNPEDHEVRLADLTRLVGSGKYQAEADRVGEAIIREALGQS